MAKKNDAKILQLKEAIKNKKALIKRTENFNPKTNCVFNLHGGSYNFNVCTTEQLVYLLVSLNSLQESAENLKINDFSMNGFLVEDWISDIQNKLAAKSRKEEKQKLEKLEEKLHKLLSEEKKIELELEEIEDLI